MGGGGKKEGSMDESRKEGWGVWMHGKRKEGRKVTVGGGRKEGSMSGSRKKEGSMGGSRKKECEYGWEEGVREGRMGGRRE
jgi:hypothetical protein